MSFGLSRSRRFFLQLFPRLNPRVRGRSAAVAPHRTSSAAAHAPHPDSTTLRVTANEVLVPTLVEKRGGGIVYGLKPQDFVLEDNGVPQKIRVQEEMDTAPVALVVAVEMGGMSVLEFDKLAKLGPLLDLFLADDRSLAALVGFDSKPHLIRDFTHSGDEINQSLKHLQPGDGGDAILDSVSYAVDLLETQPKEYRRVLLLISEERDHGSKHTKTGAVDPQDRPVRCAGNEHCRSRPRAPN